MSIFLQKYILTLIMISVYGLVGGHIIIPFRKYLKYPIFAAPLAGMLTWAMAVFFLYSGAQLSVGFSAILFASISSCLTIACIIYLRPVINWREIYPILIFIIFISAILVYFINYSSIQLNDQVFLFSEGSDQVGYTAMADWLNTHLISHRPYATPSAPVESWPALLMDQDPRFGSFFSLAIISFLFGQSSIFIYDNACVIILITAYLGVASVFSRSHKTFFLLFIGLLFNFWFVLSRSGYFGKFLGLASMLYILGLYVNYFNKETHSQHDNFSIIMFLILTFAASMAYPGQVLGLCVITAGTLLILLNIINVKKLNIISLLHIRNHAALLLIIVFVACAASGGMSEPLRLSLSYFHNSYPPDWLLISLYALDLRLMCYDLLISWYTMFTQSIFLVLTIGSTFILWVLTLIKRNVIACTLSSTALCFLLFTFIFSMKLVQFSLPSLFYTLTICAFIWFVDDLFVNKQTKLFIALTMFLTIFSISLHVPAYIEAVNHFVFNGVPPSTQYSKKELTQLAEQISNKSVIVDIPTSMYALPILVELGKRDDMHLQWSPETWRNILGYRPWEPPKIKPTRYLLSAKKEVYDRINLEKIQHKECKIVTETRQYELLDCPKISEAMLPFSYKNHPV